MGLATRGSFGLVGLVLLAAACGGGGGSGGMGRVKVLVTDKRFDLDLVQEALVHVTKITLSRSDDDDDEGEKQDGGDHDDEDDDDQGEDDDDEHDDHDGHDDDDDDDDGHHGDHAEFVLYPGTGIEHELCVTASAPISRPARFRPARIGWRAFTSTMRSSC